VRHGYNKLATEGVNTTSLSGLQCPVVIFPRGHAVVSRIQSASDCLTPLHTIEALMQKFCISKTATMWKIIVQLLSFLHEIDCGLCGVCVCVCVCVCLLRRGGRGNNSSCCRSQIELIKILLIELMIEKTYSGYFY